MYVSVFYTYDMTTCQNTKQRFEVSLMTVSDFGRNRGNSTFISCQKVSARPLEIGC